jgi:hypothetical protein
MKSSPLYLYVDAYILHQSPVADNDFLPSAFTLTPCPGTASNASASGILNPSSAPFL